MTTPNTRYKVKHVSKFAANGPEWYWFFTKGHQWLVFDEQEGDARLGYATADEAKATASKWNSEPEESCDC